MLVPCALVSLLNQSGFIVWYCNHNWAAALFKNSSSSTKPCLSSAHAILLTPMQVTCCAHPRCNAVEPTMDPTTLVLPEPSPTAINITCYTSIADPTDPNSPPMVYPVTYPARLGDGNTTQATVCSSFSYDRCTNAMPDRQLQCSAAEAEAGVWETLYFAGTTGDCYKGHLDGTNGLNNRVCCAEDNCNDPTDAMDDKAKVWCQFGLLALAH